MEPKCPYKNQRVLQDLKSLGFFEGVVQIKFRYFLVLKLVTRDYEICENYE